MLSQQPPVDVAGAFGVDVTAGAYRGIFLSLISLFSYRFLHRPFEFFNFPSARLSS